MNQRLKLEGEVLNGKKGATPITGGPAEKMVINVNQLNSHWKNRNAILPN